MVREFETEPMPFQINCLRNSRIECAPSPQGSLAYFGKANVRFASGDLSGALADYGKIIAQKQNEADYARFYRNLILRQVGKVGDDDLAKQVSGWKESWKKEIGLFLVGQLPADEFIRSAAAQNNAWTKRDHLCEANYFVGMTELIAGHTATARQKLSDSVKTGASEFVQFMLAKAALAQLSVYVVQPGDSGVVIAEKSGVSLLKLSELNRDVDWLKLSPGQKIQLPLDD